MSTCLCCYMNEVLEKTFKFVKRNKDNEDVQQDEQQALIETEQSEQIIPNNYTYQTSELFGIYFGKVGYWFYQICIIAYMFGTVCGYAQVTASNLTSLIPVPSLLKEGETWSCSDTSKYSDNCNFMYWMYIVICLVVSSGLVFVNLANQNILQMIFTCCRFICIIITIVLTIYCLSTQPFLDKSEYTKDNYINPYTTYTGFDPINFGNFVSSVIFSLSFQHSICNIIQPCKKEEQHNLNKYLIYSNILLAIFTFLVTIPGSLYFGPSSTSTDLITLNFDKWTGKDFSGENKQVYAQVFTYIIELLPPIFVLPAIPINALTMSLNVLNLLPQKYQQKKWCQILIKLLCVVPEILIAGGIKQLNTIITFTGLFGFILVGAPAGLLVGTNIKWKNELKDQKFNFTSILSKAPVVYSILGLLVIFFGFTIYSIFASL